MSSARVDRLREEYERLTLIEGMSTILELQAHGEPPERYIVSFRGRGPCRAGSSRGGVDVAEVHRVEIRLPFGYPQDPPDVRWLTPIVHPNVSYSGFLSLREIGIPWTEAVTLDVVCERLWDVARVAYVNTEEVVNYPAQRWLDAQNPQSLPMDARPLRDVVPPPSRNIVRYEWRDRSHREEVVDDGPEEILYIGEDTPVPPLPRGERGDDILYIE